jgi:hypothetical protein
LFIANVTVGWWYLPKVGSQPRILVEKVSATRQTPSPGTSVRPESHVVDRGVDDVEDGFISARFASVQRCPHIVVKPFRRIVRKHFDGVQLGHDDPVLPGPGEMPGLIERSVAVLQNQLFDAGAVGFVVLRGMRSGNSFHQKHSDSAEIDLPHDLNPGDYVGVGVLAEVVQEGGLEFGQGLPGALGAACRQRRTPRTDPEPWKSAFSSRISKFEHSRVIVPVPVSRGQVDGGDDDSNGVVGVDQDRQLAAFTRKVATRTNMLLGNLRVVLSVSVQLDHAVGKVKSGVPGTQSDGSYLPVAVQDGYRDFPETQT